MDLTHHQEQVKIKQKENSKFFKRLKKEIKPLYKKIEDAIFTKEQPSGDFKSFVNVDGKKKYETPYKFFDVLTTDIKGPVTGLALNEKAIFNFTYSIYIL